jgi:hypothetical protein
MKSLSRLFFFLAVAVSPFVFMACPVSSDYPLGEKNTEKIDPQLIGTWTNDSTTHEATKVTIKKIDDYTYDLHVDETGESFMADYYTYHAWLTTLKGKRFMVLQAMNGETETDEYYVYNIDLNSNKLITHNITLKVNGTDAITSIEAYREEVSASMKMDDFLSGEIVWKKQ